jgi:hypothetical protein
LRHGLARHPPWGGRIRLRKSVKNNLFRKRFLIHASKSFYPVSYKKPFSEVSTYCPAHSNIFKAIFQGIAEAGLARVYFGDLPA